MANKRLLFASMVTLLSLMTTPVSAGNPTDINLGVRYVDPEQGENGSQRLPVLIPHVGIDDYTLIFYTPCDGCILRLLDENENVAFTTVIPDGTTSLILPSYLSGDYQLQIVSGYLCFYGFVSLF
ncbi:MAG: hypothetical protein IJQ60_00610 [Prevotella sp.]|nr:hypothetical protein [Prevotella sp.]